MRSLGIHLRALSLDDVKIPINKTRLKIAVLKWHLGLPGANELTHWPLGDLDAIFFNHISLAWMLSPVTNVNLKIPQRSGCNLTSIQKPTVETRQSQDHLIFIMGIPIPERQFYIEMGSMHIPCDRYDWHRSERHQLWLATIMLLWLFPTTIQSLGARSWYIQCVGNRETTIVHDVRLSDQNVTWACMRPGPHQWKTEASTIPHN